MTIVKDILSYMESIAPESMKMDWDNVGLLCGNPGKEVKKILVALDPFQNVCMEAAEWNADLLVTHHPLIFQPLKQINYSNPIGNCIRILIENDIAAFNAHTNLDCAPDGVNDCLAKEIGLEDISVINPLGKTSDGRDWGLLRCGTVPEQSLETFLSNVKSKLGCKALRYVDVEKKVSKVCVGGGSCGSGLSEVISNGCDTFVTSDIKYNQFWDAKDAGINLIDAGHFYTENPVCVFLVKKLKEQFPNVDIRLSKTHFDPMRFF